MPEVDSCAELELNDDPGNVASPPNINYNTKATLITDEFSCDTTSLSTANFLLLGLSESKLTANEMHNLLLGCGVKMNLIDMNKKTLDLDGLAEICKAKIARLSGKTEKFIIKKADAKGSNPLTCPPYAPGDAIISVFRLSKKKHITAACFLNKCHSTMKEMYCYFLIKDPWRKKSEMIISQFINIEGDGTVSKQSINTNPPLTGLKLEKTIGIKIS
ncbi:hypothetical protein D6829_02235 [Candidatus Pacearchaeota archaeon]|nr:MAG: hypothetical protein D6829_02235 [Candidatus Pacearchaeota archaeon]